MTEAEKATETEKAYVHWLYKAAGAGSRGLLKKLERVWTAQEIYRMAREGVLADKLDARQRKQAERIQAAADSRDVTGEYEKLRARGICFVTAKEDAYPRRLKAVHDAPYALYYAGRLSDDGQKYVALIGTRNCSEYGKGMDDGRGHQPERIPDLCDRPELGRRVEAGHRLPVFGFRRNLSEAHGLYFRTA